MNWEPGPCSGVIGLNLHTYEYHLFEVYPGHDIGKHSVPNSLLRHVKLRSGLHHECEGQATQCPEHCHSYLWSNSM